VSWLAIAAVAVPLLLGGVLWLTAAIERWLAATEKEDHSNAQDRL
jgi:hypothetical protein